MARHFDPAGGGVARYGAAASLWLALSATACGGDPEPETQSVLPATASAAGAPGSNPPAPTAPASTAPPAAPASAAPPSDVPASAPPPGEPLPDLVLDAAYLIDTTVEDTIEADDPCQLAAGCVSGLGTRRVVRFGSRTGNLGSADLVLGAREEDNPYWTPNACNGSVDLAGFARYELRDQASGAIVAGGGKDGFCIADAEPWDVASEQSCERYSCQDQGISRGCSDSYGFVLECQWVDITGVAPGRYTLRVTINADQVIPELDYANDVVEVGLEIGEDSVLVQR